MSEYDPIIGIPIGGYREDKDATIEALRGEVAALTEALGESRGTVKALSDTCEMHRKRAEKAEAEAARLQVALVLAQDAMRDRRDYCLGWEWKYKADWDAEDEAVSKALAGETT